MAKDMIQESKIDLRKRLVLTRRETEPDAKKAADSAIAHRALQHLHLRSAHTVCTYVSLPDEVDTISLITSWLASDKTVVVPRIEDNGTLGLHTITTIQDLYTGTFGIREPQTLNTVDVGSIEVFVVPGVGFTLQGERLGRGKGYYDKLLKNSQAPNIGLCYSSQIVPYIPHEPYDILMTEIITEKETVICRNE